MTPFTSALPGRYAHTPPDEDDDVTPIGDPDDDDWGDDDWDDVDDDAPDEDDDDEEPMQLSCGAP